tara:strand:- start:3286 stop:3474 length:189 start_codon:yes stop_codon:yes gene_type:complete
MSTDGQIFELEKSIVKSIDKLNENLSMIALQLYYSSSMDTDPFKNERIKNFLADSEKLQRGR